MKKSSALFLGLALVAVTLAAEVSRSIWDGVYTAAQVARGKASYLTQCADCHGEELQGIKKATPLKGPEFLKTWKNKSVHKLIDQTRRTMPPDEPNTFSRELCADVAAYILSENGYPVGKSELKHDAPDLRQILITAPK
jgi:mono/diheme cytochrome c family protein